MLRNGDKLLVVHRRLFDEDQSRFFIGSVEEYDAGLVKVAGHAFVRDPLSGKYLGRLDARIKILSLSSGTLIVYQLPQNTQLENIQFSKDSKGGITVTDGDLFSMDISEIPHDVNPKK